MISIGFRSWSISIDWARWGKRHMISMTIWSLQMTKLCEDQHPAPALTPPLLLPKCRLTQLSTNACYKNAPWRGTQHVIRLNLLLAVRGIGDFVAYIFRPLTTSEKHLEGTMEQDRRLNNGLLMHVKKLIMNDPDTFKVTSKQTTFCSTRLAQRTSWEIWVEVYAWLGVRWAPHLPPVTLVK